VRVQLNSFEDERATDLRCVRHNILAAIDWLVSEPGYASAEHAIKEKIY